MKLHLGCGERVLPGWVHIDARDFPHVDRHDRLDRLDMQDGAADQIYACHVLEHFGRWQVPVVLAEWFRVIAPGGRLWLAVPDIEALCLLYRITGDLRLILGPLYGRQDYAENTHRAGFDFKTLSGALYAVGWRNVHRYDWRETEFADLDDGAQHYHPHLDKDAGLHISLNVVAEKV